MAECPRNALLHRPPGRWRVLRPHKSGRTCDIVACTNGPRLCVCIRKCACVHPNVTQIGKCKVGSPRARARSTVCVYQITRVCARWRTVTQAANTHTLIQCRICSCALCAHFEGIRRRRCCYYQARHHNNNRHPFAHHHHLAKVARRSSSSSSSSRELDECVARAHTKVADGFVFARRADGPIVDMHTTTLSRHKRTHLCACVSKRAGASVCVCVCTLARTSRYTCYVCSARARVCAANRS